MVRIRFRARALRVLELRLRVLLVAPTRRFFSSVVFILTERVSNIVPAISTVFDRSQVSERGGMKGYHKGRGSKYFIVIYLS